MPDRILVFRPLHGQPRYLLGIGLLAGFIAEGSPVFTTTHLNMELPRDFWSDLRPLKVLAMRTLWGLNRGSSPIEGQE